MDYSKMKSSIDRAILKSPLDVAAYDDKFALCRDYEGASSDWLTNGTRLYRRKSEQD